jgi:DNA-binding protein H-NS
LALIRLIRETKSKLWNLRVENILSIPGNLFDYVTNLPKNIDQYLTKGSQENVKKFNEWLKQVDESVQSSYRAREAARAKKKHELLKAKFEEIATQNEAYQTLQSNVSLVTDKLKEVEIQNGYLNDQLSHDHVERVLQPLAENNQEIAKALKEHLKKLENLRQRNQEIQNKLIDLLNYCQEKFNQEKNKLENDARKLLAAQEFVNSPSPEAGSPAPAEAAPPPPLTPPETPPTPLTPENILTDTEHQLGQEINQVITAHQEATPI